MPFTTSGSSKVPPVLPLTVNVPNTVGSVNSSKSALGILTFLILSRAAGLSAVILPLAFSCTSDTLMATGYVLFGSVKPSVA